jgi:hypothetical protein
MFAAMAVSRGIGEQTGLVHPELPPHHLLLPAPAGSRPERASALPPLRKSGLQVPTAGRLDSRGSAGGAEPDGLGNLPELIVREMVPLAT